MQVTWTFDCSDAPFHASDVIANVTIYRGE